MHTMELDTLLHKTCIKVLRLDMCTSMISLSEIAHLKYGAITHSAKETRQQNEQWGWGLEATEKGDWTKFEEAERGQYRGGIHKIGGVRTPLQTIYTDTLKLKVDSSFQAGYWKVTESL